MKPPIRILVADAHRMDATLVARVISAEKKLQVTCHFDPLTVISTLQSSHFDLLLTEIFFRTGKSGLEILREARVFFPRLPILVFSAYPREIYGWRAMRAGAIGFLERTVSISAVFQAIHTALQPSRNRRPRGRQLPRHPLSSPCDVLSDAELTVLHHTGTVAPVSEIAGRLRRSDKTITHHKTEALRKMGCGDTPELIARAVELGLV